MNKFLCLLPRDLKAYQSADSEKEELYINKFRILENFISKDYNRKSLDIS